MFTYHISPENPGETNTILSISVVGDTITAYLNRNELSPTSGSPNSRQIPFWHKLPFIGSYFKSPLEKFILCSNQYITHSSAYYLNTRFSDEVHVRLHKEENESDLLHSHVTSANLQDFLHSLNKCQDLQSLPSGRVHIPHAVSVKILKAYKDHLHSQNSYTLEYNNEKYRIAPPSIVEHVTCLSEGISNRCLAYDPSQVRALPMNGEMDSLTTAAIGGFGLVAFSLFAKAFCCSKKNRDKKSDLTLSVSNVR